MGHNLCSEPSKLCLLDAVWDNDFQIFQLQGLPIRDFTTHPEKPPEQLSSARQVLPKYTHMLF